MRKQILSRLAGFMRLGAAIALGLGFSSACASAVSELHFDTLTIGSQVYSNVTVTTKNKTYVFLHHAAGMMNVKVAELSPEEKETLGYEPKKPATNLAANWAKTTMAKIESPQVKNLEKTIEAARAKPAADILGMIKPMIGVPTLLLFLGILFAFYLFMCYCSMLICKKAGAEPGAMVWIPVLQMFPLLRAAKMSPFWFLASVLPVLNIIAHLVWCVKISQARAKSFWTAIFLILPFTNFFAFLYLAFSDGAEPKEETPKRADMMVLGTA